MGSWAVLFCKSSFPPWPKSAVVPTPVVHHYGDLATSWPRFRTQWSCLSIPSFHHIYGPLYARQCSRSSGYISDCKRTNGPTLTELTFELTDDLIISAGLGLLLSQDFCLLPSYWGFWLWSPQATIPLTLPKRGCVSSAGRLVDWLFFGQAFISGPVSHGQLFTAGDVGVGDPCTDQTFWSTLSAAVAVCVVRKVGTVLLPAPTSAGNICSTEPTL